MKSLIAAVFAFVLAAVPAHLMAQGASIWESPDDARRSRLFYGPGSKESAPTLSDSFTRLKSSNGKSLVQDSRGRTWYVVSGPQAKSTAASSRILYALGFFVSENYFLHELKTTDSGKPMQDICLVRRPDTSVNLGGWSWTSNAFLGKKEFDGFKVAMILLANWGVGESDNAILLDPASHERQYTVIRSGESLGRAVSRFGRSISSYKEYKNAKFISGSTSNDVSFAYSSQSGAISKTVSLEAAIWLGHLFDDLPSDRLVSAFDAAGYTREESAAFASALKVRASALVALKNPVVGQ